MKILLYFISFVAFIPGAASFAKSSKPDVSVPVSIHIEITNRLYEGEGDEASGSMQTDRMRLPLQDTLQNDRQKKIKQVPQARPQSKPERVGERPPVGQGAGGIDRRQPQQPDPIQGGRDGRPGINPGTGGINGGNGQDRGRQQAPPPPGR